MPSKLKKAIGAVKDQTSISLAKVASNNTSNLEVAVLKATTHDDIPMDDRYVHEVVQLVSSSKIYAAACARAIGKRIGRTRNWIVVLKSLMLVLRNFQDGDPYFPREILHAMKRGAKILNLSSFRDDSNSSPWDFTAFVRTFALYLDERLDCFLTGKLQRRYTHRDGESTSHRSRRPNEPVRDMKPAMLLDRISYWQRLLERAIATRPTGAAKTNRLVQICLYAIVQESFDLYKDISDGLALLLDSFFHLQYQNCISAFQTCVKASKQFEELSAFYSLCKSIGVGRTSEYPSVQTISEELIETLQEFLKDQSSFPAITKSPNRQVLLLPAPPVPRSGGHDSYGGQSEFSVTTEGYSEMTSEFGSQCTSLEDLISATETGTCPAISIDLEAYSDQFEKQSQRDSTFKISDTGSTRSLPASNSMLDLVSLGDWPEDEDDKQGQEQDQKEKKLESAKSWDLVLAETMTESARSSPNIVNSFNAFPEAATPSAHISPNLANSFNAFPGAATPSAQPLPDAANNFNPFPDTTASSSKPSLTVANSFNFFSDTTTPSVQSLPNVANSFNGFPEAAIPSIPSTKALRTDSFNGFPEATTPSAQSGNPLRTSIFNAFPEAATPSAQSGNSLRTNSFNGFPEAATPSAQSEKSLRTDSLKAFPEAATPSAQSAKSLRTGSFKTLRANSFNAFPEDATPSTQPLPDAANSFNAFPESTMSPPQALPYSSSFNAFPQTTKPSMQPLPNTADSFNGFLEQKQGQTANSFSVFPDQGQGQRGEVNGQREVSRTGWELALVETTTQSGQSTPHMNSSFNMSTLDSIYNQSSLPPHHYNPFLQDATELPAISNVAPTFAASSTLQPASSVANMWSSAPTFKATPTFSTQNPNSTIQNENDPFAACSSAFSSEQMFTSSKSQQNLLHEQQLWLQNQNKIISKHSV